MKYVGWVNRHAATIYDRSSVRLVRSAPLACLSAAAAAAAVLLSLLSFVVVVPPRSLSSNDNTQASTRQLDLVVWSSMALRSAVASAQPTRTASKQSIRIFTDILWRVFHRLTEPLPYTFVCIRRCFEYVSRKYEPSNVVSPLFGPPCRPTYMFDVHGGSDKT